MKLSLKNPIVLCLLSLMAGMLMTVSFLETPLKFQVQGMALTTALGLGKLMFGVSTKIQNLFLFLILAFMMISYKNYTKFDFLIIIVFLILLSLQQYWMLPVLGNRVDLLSSGRALPPTPVHDYFIYAESAKTALVLIAIISQFKKHIADTENNHSYTKNITH
ncbi:hypothetical protein SAMN05421692_1165 [Chryseobacterium indologenes]|uniref:hypothetical protein n=1 Tax=Chryseobacterium indologenes TaxID=253 RepID=UPI0008EAAD03|nr:hypothetical protein [Chryseobacterium indologenes]SFJ11899.1 hypothetical protein SAMN05421692_1165 [Chryseobacterium indologenes]SUX49244.1 Uncharacterised protein [Chryseobacterium indologenes]